MRWSFAVVTDSGQYFVFFPFFPPIFLLRHTFTRHVHVVLFVDIFDHQMCESLVAWCPCPHMIDSKLTYPNKHQVQNLLPEEVQNSGA